MYKSIFFFLLIPMIHFLRVNGEGCLIEDRQEELCPETEYQAYIECLHHQRSKRSVCNSEPCNECNCSYCEKNECSEMCNDCCEISFDTCQTNYCCYKKCHSKCNSGECRRSCRKSCQDNIEEKKIILKEESVQIPNITTVINLHNQINNTNVLDIPIKIETQNFNNITVETPDLNIQSDQGIVEVENEEDETEINTEVPKDQDEKVPEEDKNCCQVISPRQCVPQNVFPFMRCFHYRQNVCGNICQAKIMHTQTHQICDEQHSGPPECHNQIIYIPQPQPRCNYLDTWPYVSCNIESMDASYNVGPFQPVNQYPFGQFPYQPNGFNYNPYNPQMNPFSVENYFSVTKNVDGITFDENENHKNDFDKLIDFTKQNDISETIPIDVDVRNYEKIDPELVRVEVEKKSNLIN